MLLPEWRVPVPTGRTAATSSFQRGGIATQIGSLFFLAIVWISMTGRGTKPTALSVLLFGSLILTHHLSALISTSVMAFYVALSLLVRAYASLALASC